jgi:glycosyltransferase involved in cell wall biosynthesis
MRVLLVANFEPDSQNSMRLYADWVERMAQAAGHDVTVIRPTPFLARISRRARIKKNLGYLDKFLIFPPRLMKTSRHFDLVHVLDHSNSMYLKFVSGRHTLITCHDLLAVRAARGEFPQVIIGWTGRLLQRWILSGLRGAEYAICVSEKTAKDLRQLTADDCPQIRIIYNGLNCEYGPGASLSAGLVARLGLPPEPLYLIHVGGNSWYKNRLGVLCIFSHFARLPGNAGYKLVMVGTNLTPEMVKFVRENGLSDRVIEAVGIGSSELRQLYCNASALLFPSFEEGFGWPVLEAQACGCPVVTTGRPPMTEVAGEAAIFIDPNEAEQAALAMSGGIRNGDILREAGFKNLMRFDQETITKEYMDFYGAAASSCTSSTSPPVAELHGR